MEESNVRPSLNEVATSIKAAVGLLARRMCASDRAGPLHKVIKYGG